MLTTAGVGHRWLAHRCQLVSLEHVIEVEKVLDVLRRSTEMPVLSSSIAEQGEGRTARALVRLPGEIKFRIRRRRTRRERRAGITGIGPQRSVGLKEFLLLSEIAVVVAVGADTVALLDVNGRTMVGDGGSDEILFVSAEKRRYAASAVLGVELRETKDQ